MNTPVDITVITTGDVRWAVTVRPESAQDLEEPPLPGEHPDPDMIFEHGRLPDYVFTYRDNPDAAGFLVDCDGDTDGERVRLSLDVPGEDPVAAEVTCGDQPEVIVVALPRTIPLVKGTTTGCLDLTREPALDDGFCYHKETVILTSAGFAAWTAIPGQTVIPAA